MKIYPLDKTLKSGSLFRAEGDKAYIIRAVGTTSAGKATLKVAGGLCLEFFDVVAPTQVKAANRWSLLPLEDRYIVVPPTKTLEILGDADKFVRIKGEIIELGAGELLTEPHMRRFERQTKEYISYKDAVWESAAAAKIPKGTITVMIDYAVPAGERHSVRRRYMGYTDCTAYPSGTFLEQLGTRIYVQGAPLDILEDTMGYRGISSVAAPRPPSDDTGAEGFTLEGFPIVLEPGRRLTIEAWNAGDAFTLGTDQKCRCKVTVVIDIDLLS